MVALAGTVKVSALILLLSITTPFSSPVIQFTVLVSSCALPPINNEAYSLATYSIPLLFSRLAQFTHTTFAPVVLLLAATAMLKGPLGSFAPCSAVDAWA